MPPEEDYGASTVMSEGDATTCCCSQISINSLAGSRFPGKIGFWKDARELIIASGQRLRFFGIALPTASWSEIDWMLLHMEIIDLPVRL